jgi:hypothetical protein
MDGPYLDRWRHGPLHGTGSRPSDSVEVKSCVVIRATSRKIRKEINGSTRLQTGFLATGSGIYTRHKAFECEGKGRKEGYRLPHIDY